LGLRRRAEADQPRELAIGSAVRCQGDQADAFDEVEFAADDQREVVFLRRDVSLYYAGQRAFVGNCQASIAKGGAACATSSSGREAPRRKLKQDRQWSSV
jgi:hypothetical protein